MFIHNVYFTLEDAGEPAVQRLLASCDEHLTGHDGTLLYARGTLSDMERPVNDRDFDVCLTVVFEDRAAHDAYQRHPRHQAFLEQNAENWKAVRVFDAEGAGPA